jgi:SanA protein
MRLRGWGCAVLVGLGVVGLAALTGVRYWVDTTYSERIYADVEQIPPRPVAIVFGAGVTPAGRLSPILADRVNTAFRLYRAGRVNKLLLSGDDRSVNYNEPGSMAAYLRERGMPDADMVLDNAGRRTYDSCYRARHIFGVERAVLVTQNYHLDRAMFTCDRLGIDVVGLAANGRRPTFFYWLREMPATAVAWLDINVRHPMPAMGDLGLNPQPDWGPDPQAAPRS